MVGWIKPMCSQGSCFRVNAEVSFGWSLQSKHFCYSTSSKMKAPVPREKCIIQAWDVTLTWKVGAASWLLSSVNTRSNGQFFLTVMRGSVLFPKYYFNTINRAAYQGNFVFFMSLGEFSCKLETCTWCSGKSMEKTEYGRVLLLQGPTGNPNTREDEEWIAQNWSLFF